MEILEKISQGIQDGEEAEVVELVKEALEAGLSSNEILENGLVAGMMIIGDLFRQNEVYVPEVMISARALNAGLDVLEPEMVKTGAEHSGVAVIGTIQGDLHDIGKNLVVIMLKGAGFEVHDLGSDVAPETFIEKAEEYNAEIICISALLTTTMPNMKAVIDQLKEAGLRDKYYVCVGGAPVTKEFADSIGADGYTSDAASCARAVREVVKRR